MAEIINYLETINPVLAAFYASIFTWILTATGAASVFFVYQQYLIQDRDRKLCFQAFVNNNWFGMVIFIGLALDYLL